MRHSKWPGSSIADQRGLYCTKCDEEIFRNHLEDKEECIYHELVLGYDDLIKAFEREFGTKVMLTFREKGTTYPRIFLIIFFKSCRPNLLMVRSTSSLRNNKWATFYMKEEKEDTLKNDADFTEMFEMSFPKVNEEQVHAAT